jgi:hypothetical protein
MKAMLTSFFALFVVTSPSFAAKKHHSARVHAPIVEPYTAPIAPIAPRPVDEVWGACGHMSGVFSCPGN